ncbi:hypothetical protein [Halarchaeum sp. CBA1220]|nr:hypothetical protein [Halarchaeum sp. CBA1220]
MNVAERLGDLWFAFKSDRDTLACYRDVRANKRVLSMMRDIDGDRRADR